MRIPESLSDRLPFLEALEEDWEPVARWAAIAWLVFYALFLLQEIQGHGILLLMDGVFVPIHEGGHLLFRWFGNQWLYIAGGTFMQLFVPFALAGYFAIRRQPQGVAFCTFFFFEQFLPIARYMADARAQQLPLLTVGDSEYIIHDWHYLFSSVGLLNCDTKIAAAVRALGWIGMIATMAWLAYRSHVIRSAPLATSK